MNESSLRQTQRRLAAEILAHAAGTAPADGDGAAALLRLPAAVDADSRLAVYRDGYPARIVEALGDAYPAIANICGEGSFANLTRRYLRDCDVSRSSLNDIGRQFAGHCERDPLAERLPFLADLARLEWAVLRAFHSREVKSVDPAIFAVWDMADWERVAFAWQPSIAVLHSPWPILDLWLTRDTERTAIDVDLSNRPQAVAVHRRGLDVDCRLLSETEAAVLQSLLRGATLGSAMAIATTDADAEAVAAMFSDWLAAGWITGAQLALSSP